MASRGRGRRGCPRGASQAPSAFDQQAFVEAVGVAAGAFAHASAAMGQEVRVTSRDLGPIILQRLQGGGDSMVTDHWFMQVEKILEAIEITSDTTKIRLAAFQLEGEAQVWWN